MALGTTTVVTQAGGKPSAPLFIDLITAVGPASYTAGGEAFDPATAALLGTGRTVIAVHARAVVTATGFPATTMWEWDPTNKKLVGLVEARTEESGDLSAQTLYITVISY